jgi:CDGSH-type Zn-finger protein
MFLNRNQPENCGFYVIVLYQTNTYMSKTKLTINNNASVKIEGDFEIVDRNGNTYGLQGREVLSICRCGLSKNKPFCDGAHNGHFEHEAIAFDLPPKKV